VISDHLGWKWIFWFLAILSGICLILLAFFLPETSRKIVGNGSMEPHGIHKTLLSILFPVKSSSITAASTGIKREFRVPNPLTSLYIIFHKDVTLIMLVHGTFYTTYSCIGASLSSLFIRIYGLSASQAGLSYLPSGFACILASYLSGMACSAS
jgi:predicted MFS family arabinose efflux permease